ncbi:efflux RND transporter periplasmic adaptor subunit [Flavobacterium sp. CSZ]|uniref:efflux RND transporter periplasmic adaptor subunit n=1 Tax=Flavobacterium sp. CSZ TaxID=2783791 RepID=UPI00188D833F|nr:efflux RND transporter periplasmic adaptor subunit [Flavobacterium sp. CSZ]MBF4485723.1 efflux RND transporter periplasmic adaptor subunit [Flavobacterium sp. CSZ]
MKTIKIHLYSFMVLATVFGCNSKTEIKTVTPLKVTILPLKAINRLQQLNYSATIEADNTAQISFAVSGVVNNVAVQEGQTIRQGQLLASIDGTTYSNSLKISNASYVQSLDLFNRRNELYKKGSLPAKDYIDVKMQLEQAEANKRTSEKQLSDTRLYSPMTGIVTQRYIERGSSAAPGTPAFNIIKTDLVNAKITVPESEVGLLKQGMEAVVFIPTLNDSIIGRIDIINPQADDKSKSYTVKIKINNNNKRLLPGMLADVTIKPQRSEQVIAIPATSVVRDTDDLTYVYVIRNGNKAVRQRITVGKIIGKQEIIIQDGLKEKDKIVVQGQTRISDGDTVTF